MRRKPARERQRKRSKPTSRGRQESASFLVQINNKAKSSKGRFDVGDPTVPLMTHANGAFLIFNITRTQSCREQS